VRELIIVALCKRFERLHHLKERLLQSPIIYRLARGAFWSLLGGVGSRIFSMVSTIIVARLLGREGYGELGMVQSTMGLFGVLAGFGLGYATTKYIAEFKYKDPAKASRILNLNLFFSLLISGLMMVVCMAMSSWLARTSLNRPELDGLLAAGSILLFISAIGGVLSATLSGYEAFPQIAKINIIQGAVTPLTSIPLVWFYGVQGAIASLTISAALGVFLCSRAIKYESLKHDISLTFNRSVWSEWPVLWHFALPAMASGVMFAPVTWISNLILVNQPSGYSELGLFNAANQWRLLIIFLPALLSSAMLPVLSETHGKADQSDFRKTVALNFSTIWILALPLTVMVVILGKPLAAIFGKQFIGAESIIVILMLGVFLYVVNSPVGTALAAAGKMWVGTLMNLGWGVVLILSSLMLVPRLGGQGLAIAYLISYLFHAIWVMAYMEIKLAPSAIMRQWLLITLSILLLAVSAHASLLDASNYIMYKVLLVLLSFIPLIRLLRAKIFQHI
jgi:O-antigen/teichoic acid export membrane protein